MAPIPIQCLFYSTAFPTPVTILSSAFATPAPFLPQRLFYSTPSLCAISFPTHPPTVSPHLCELLRVIKIIVQRVLSLFGIGNVARVADGCLDETAGRFGGLDAQLQVVNV
eukprot:scaffold32171_cov73-Isochrysis_galbana.AAC.1